MLEQLLAEHPIPAGARSIAVVEVRVGHLGTLWILEVGKGIPAHGRGGQPAQEAGEERDGHGAVGSRRSWGGGDRFAISSCRPGITARWRATRALCARVCRSLSPSSCRQACLADRVEDAVPGDQPQGLLNLLGQGVSELNEALEGGQIIDPLHLHMHSLGFLVEGAGIQPTGRRVRCGIRRPVLVEAKSGTLRSDAARPSAPGQWRRDPPGPGRLPPPRPAGEAPRCRPAGRGARSPRGTRDCGAFRGGGVRPRLPGSETVALDLPWMVPAAQTARPGWHCSSRPDLSPCLWRATGLCAHGVPAGPGRQTPRSMATVVIHNAGGRMLHCGYAAGVVSLALEAHLGCRVLLGASSHTNLRWQEADSSETGLRHMICA